MLALTKEEMKWHQGTKVFYICRKGIFKKFPNNIDYWKVRHHWHYIGKYRDEARSICNLKFNVPNGIPAVFYDG